MSKNEAALASLPSETVEYLRSRRDFDYPRDSCECGDVVLRSLDSLCVERAYVVGPTDGSEPAWNCATHSWRR